MAGGSPSISAADFETVCRELVEASQACELPNFQISQAQHEGGAILTICRIADDPVETHPIYEEVDDDDDDEGTFMIQDEYDFEEVVLERSHEKGRPLIEYRILLSPTYGVPVLYIQIRGHPANASEGLRILYELLVPATAKAQLQSVGVMGGVSLTNDPVTGAPCFFVHPCQTADAMRSILPQRASARTFLQVWFGLIGPCVGLHLPKELAKRLIDKGKGYL